MFFIPLVASAAFGFTLPGKGFTLEPLTDALAGTDFAAQLFTTLELAVLSTLGSLVLLVPTLLFLHLKAPKMLRLTEWLSVVPYVVPAIALVGGANLFFRNVAPSFLVSTYSLVPFYMVLTLPLVYRSLDAGIRALDVQTLFAASASLGAKPRQTLLHVVLPNMRAALLGSALLSCAMVLGEYALASLLLHSTFPVFMVQVGMNQPRAAAALSFLTILATWLLLASLSDSDGAARHQEIHHERGIPMTRDSAEVSLSGITKAFGGRTVLDNLDLDLAGGELLALLGPSGCGKTTILRVLAGLETPDAGTVRIAGKDMTRTPVRERGIGIVFQAYSLFPHMSAVENVAYGLKIAGTSLSKRTARAKELLETVGLGEHAAKFPAQLSGGQQQRVALARALAIEPRVLLLDEPLSALDAQVRVHLREEIRRIQTQSGTTTLLVTHDQEEALTVADRVGVMLNGRIEQLGSPQEIYQRPRTPFISEFVGAVNRIPALREGNEVTGAGPADADVQHGPGPARRRGPGGPGPARGPEPAGARPRGGDRQLDGAARPHDQRGRRTCRVQPAGGHALPRGRRVHPGPARRGQHPPLLGARGCGACGMSPTTASPKTARPKIALVGIDGLRIDLARGTGRMPTLDAVIEQGVFNELVMEVPTLSGPGWSTPAHRQHPRRARGQGQQVHRPHAAAPPGFPEPGLLRRPVDHHHGRRRLAAAGGPGRRRAGPLGAARTAALRPPPGDLPRRGNLRLPKGRTRRSPTTRSTSWPPRARMFPSSTSATPTTRATSTGRTPRNTPRPWTGSRATWRASSRPSPAASRNWGRTGTWC